jgi:vacuolar protein sorting-associated protein 54
MTIKIIIAIIIAIIKIIIIKKIKIKKGAQALQSSAKLKSISAKHLSITAQSLSFVFTLLPHVRSCLLSQLPPKHHLLLIELDRLSTELNDHHGEVLNKFVIIVADFVDFSSNKLKLFDWDLFSTTNNISNYNNSNNNIQNNNNQNNSNSSCEYFDEIQKNVLALHRVLVSILPREQIQDVFFRIFTLLSRKIPQHFESIMPTTATGKQRIVDEIVFLINVLNRLKIIDSNVVFSNLEKNFVFKYL